MSRRPPTAGNAAGPGSRPPRPWWRKKRFTLPSTLLVGLLALALVGALASPATAPPPSAQGRHDTPSTGSHGTSAAPAPPATTAGATARSPGTTGPPSTPATTAPAGTVGHHSRRSVPPARAHGLRCPPGDPLADVYHPYRLHVRRRCLVVVGTVGYVSEESDGDTHIDLDLPASETHLLDAANREYEDGQLVTEIVPADEPGCTPGRAPRAPHGSYDYGICTGADIHTPPVGAKVAVAGPYVLDADHGWMEIHPVRAVEVLAAPMPSTTPTTRPATTTAPAPTATAPSTPNAGGAWCRATASPASDGYAGDYDVYVHSNQPHEEATASDAGDTYRYETNGSGYADVYLWHTSPGERISVTVGAASCSTTAS